VTEFRIEWVDGERAPSGVPDPRYPEGVNLDIAAGRSPNCQVGLPYPAPRCGFFVVTCDFCGVRIAVTTAGRPDDPRSVRIACQRDNDTKLQ
jgi:hypothetical protein